MEGPIKRLGGASNAAVVMLPGRANPGVVIQGDSLRNLLAITTAGCEALRAGNVDDGLGLAEEARELLASYVRALRDVERQE